MNDARNVHVNGIGVIVPRGRRLTSAYLCMYSGQSVTDCMTTAGGSPIRSAALFQIVMPPIPQLVVIHTVIQDRHPRQVIEAIAHHWRITGAAHQQEPPAADQRFDFWRAHAYVQQIQPVVLQRAPELTVGRQVAQNGYQRAWHRAHQWDKVLQDIKSVVNHVHCAAILPPQQSADACLQPSSLLARLDTGLHKPLCPRRPALRRSLAKLKACDRAQRAIIARSLPGRTKL